MLDIWLHLWFYQPPTYAPLPLPFASMAYTLHFVPSSCNWLIFTGQKLGRELDRLPREELKPKWAERKSRSVGAILIESRSARPPGGRESLSGAENGGIDTHRLFQENFEGLVVVVERRGW